MRRILLLPLVVCALACGGAGSLIGQDGNIYPHTRNLGVDFHNNDNQDVALWVDVTEDAVTNHVSAAGATRHLDTVQVWASESQTKDFVFHAQVGINASVSVKITLSGTESYAQNFSGFDANWSQAKGLEVTTK